MPLPDLLQWLELSRKTCVLNIAGKGFEATFYLEKGKISYASSSDRSFRLGEFMVRSEVLNASLLLHALTESRRSGILLTRFLIDAKYISIDALTEVFSRQVVALPIQNRRLYRHHTYSRLCRGCPYPAGNRRDDF
jgi:hypothetical protein